MLPLYTNIPNFYIKMKTQLVTTSDGSHTLFVPSLNEHYHSTNGAIQESLHIFIKEGLHQCSQTKINIFEVGFGTGLNAYMTMMEAEKTKKQILFSSIEAYPLSQNEIKLLNYPEQIKNADKKLFQLLHECEWNKKIKISDYFTIWKIKKDFISFQFQEQYDLFFFDAFSPEKQAEIWSEEIFEKIYHASTNNGILTTYCAKGNVRRAMQKAGFSVERIPGPPGKREMLRCRKL